MKINTDKKQIEEFLTRGVEKVFPENDALKKKLLSGEQISVYTGVDPTGPHLHLGHGTVFRKLAKLQKMGHKVVVLIGSFTAKIGDSTDKSAARTMLTDEQVQENMKSFVYQLAPIIDFNDEKNPVAVKYNADWLAKLTFDQIIDIASNFTVQQMLERDMFERRMNEGKPIHLHEFFYPLMQGYDSVVLDVDLEIGGNDQTFNMLAGRTLQRNMRNKEKFVMTTKMLTDDKGRKMSKSEGNFVALTDDEYEMFGKIMSWTDEMIVPSFETLTDLSLDEIADIQKDMEKGGNPRDHKLRLAYETVKIFKGEAEANVARDNFIEVFSKGAKPVDIPVKHVSNKNIIDALIESGLVATKSEARRVIDQKGLKVNDEVVESHDFELSKGTNLVQKGKKNFLSLWVD